MAFVAFYMVKEHPMTTEQIAEALGLKEVEYQPSDQAGSNVYGSTLMNRTATGVSAK